MDVIYVEGRTPIGKLPPQYANCGLDAVQNWTGVEIYFERDRGWTVG